MRRNTLITLITALSLTLISAGSALARPGGKRAAKGTTGLSAQLVTALQLSEAQAGRIKSLAAARKASTAPIKQRLKTQRAELKRLWKADNPNRAAIVAKHEEMSNMRTRLVDAKLTFKQGVASTLSSAQLTRLKTFRAKKAERKAVRTTKRAERRAAKSARKARKANKVRKARKVLKANKTLTAKERRGAKAARKARAAASSNGRKALPVSRDTE